LSFYAKRQTYTAKGKIFMEAVRQIMDSNLLNGIVSLPKRFHNKKVEVIVFLDEPPQNKSIKSMSDLTLEDIDGLVKGSIAESLLGILPDDGTTLEEYRAERLKKYDSTD
jgi:predicted Zn-dependent protease with MMP-like domain